MTDHPLWAILTVAAAGSAALVLLTATAVLRRRSWSYLLVMAAIGMLLVRTIVGVGTLTGIVSIGTHHVVEHLLDVVVIGLLFAAIYRARTVSPEVPVEDTPRPPESS